MNLNVPFEYQNEKIKSNLEKNVDTLKKLCSNSVDLLITKVKVSNVDCALISTDGMLSTQTVTNLIFLPLNQLNLQDVSSVQLLDYIYNNKLLSTDTKQVFDYGTLIRMTNSGFAILIADNCNYAIAFGVQGYNTRSISEPSNEQNIMGSHEGFVENVRINMSLIRRRMKSPTLKFEMVVKGSKSYTDIFICYMVDRVSKELLNRIKKSLKNIDAETILLSGYVQPFLESPKARIFDSVGYSERPDVICSKVVEGRVAILIDGTPFVLIVPKLLNDSFQTIDDYSGKPFYATFIRWLKYVSFILAIMLPAFYVAISLHNPELLNRELLILLAQSEENAPFSILIEAFGVLLVYEIIKEAGLRLPKAVGGAVSIVAGLIIGDCAVSSGLISNPLLTVSAISVVCGFTLPDLARQISVLRLCYLVVGGIFGLFGIGLLTMLTIFNACDTQDYGFPFTFPLIPFSKQCMRDVVTRVSFRKMQSGNFTINDAKFKD